MSKILDSVINDIKNGKSIDFTQTDFTYEKYFDELREKFLENLEDFTTINSETMVGSSGISHSSGGGRHEGVIQECQITKLPYRHNIYNDNTNYYNVLQLIPTNCTYDFNYSLSDFRNDYIYVY